MNKKSNIVFILADQLRACSSPGYIGHQVSMPNLEKLRKEGATFNNAISTCPVCTPYRSMLMTGRHPQTTGHLINFVNTRHDEVGLADVLNLGGYKTAYVGKWHLHRGSFPEINGADYVPEGRDRLGFQYWRGYNFHMNYYDGTVNTDDWHVEQWDDYETLAVTRYAKEFLDTVEDNPFCLFVSPHQPHFSPKHVLKDNKLAPEQYYETVPTDLKFLDNVPEHVQERTNDTYRDYLAMALSVDEMVGDVWNYLEEKELLENTLFIFTSDHGTMMGAHCNEGNAENGNAWNKKKPWEESIKVPFYAVWPGMIEAGTENDMLLSPVDIMPTLCSLCGQPVPKTVEGMDLSQSFIGNSGPEQDSLLTMNFTREHNYLSDGEEWRGVRTKSHSYARYLNGSIYLFDLEKDPLEMNNLAGVPEYSKLQVEMEQIMQEKIDKLSDEFLPCTRYANWYDGQRRVIRNAKGALPHPENEPDWSLIKGS